ncbi:MAG: UDP-N-acetylglucosamine 2-epimerase (hydrolyzing) [Muribaculaceae bacterium]|nr:UDP-N-acetylglucosamine 2-epimerase (hydrolyzing) [Muribaculaceae bacterium]
MENIETFGCKKRLCFATSTRADWGLLSPVARAVRELPDVEVLVMATNMHLMAEYGHSADEILADGFAIDAAVPMEVRGEGEAARVRAMAECMSGTADALERLRPDALVVLGDRYEMLAVASAAAVMRVPVIHIAGGEVSQGAVDDDLRHAITKLSALHLTATEAYRRRVVQMGEQPERVVNTGAIGVWNIMNRSLLGRGELEAELGFSLEPPLAVVTYHPATLADSDPKECFRVLLEALDEHPGLRVLLTYPNNDAGADGLITMIEDYASARPGRVLAVPSLGALRYLSALQCASVVVGNSSSGIVEVPSTGTVTVDVGPRQQGRLCGPSVLHCAETREDISKAVATALGDEMQAVAARRENPYYKPDTLGIMTRSIATFLRDMPPHKHFFDI